jgi:hypothetical protein
MESKLMRPGLAVALVAFTAATASAQVTEYTDQGAFNAATSGVTSYGFEGIAPPSLFVQGNITVGGVTFTGGGGLGFVFDASAGYGNYGASFFSGQSQNVGVDPSEVVCTLAGATALGFTFGDYADDPGNPFTVTLSDGSSFFLTTPDDPGHGTGFVGFVSSTPITGVSFDHAGGAAFDVIQFSDNAPVTPVPESDPLPLMAAGLLSVALLLRRRSVRVTRSS